MKKINSLKCLTTRRSRPESPVSPVRTTFPRSRSTTSAVSLLKPTLEGCEKVDAEKGSAKASPFDPIPTHEDSHAGPYGVEVPPDWSYVVSVTEFTVTLNVKPDSDDVNAKTEERETVQDRS